VQLPVSDWSLNLVLIRFIVLRFLCFALLAGNCLFMSILGEFWRHISPNMVTHRSNPRKDHPCAETRRLSHKAWISVQRFDLGVGSRKKVKTGQSKKSQGGNISLICGEAPTVPIEAKICMAGNLADVITCAKCQDDIFRGYSFTGG